MHDRREWWIIEHSRGLDVTTTSLMDLYNGPSSAVVVRVYRARIINLQSRYNSGGNALLSLVRINASAGGQRIPVSPLREYQDWPNPAVQGHFTAQINAVATLRQRRIFCDWPGGPGRINTAYTTSNWEMLLPNTIWWESSPGSTVEPLVCRPGYGLAYMSNTTIANSSLSYEFEFTTETT